MSQLSFTHAGSGCDFVQQQISDAADADGSLPAEVATHVAACAECGSFAAHWLHGAPAALTEQVPAVLPSALRERILDQNTAYNIVRFEAPPDDATRRAAWSTWAGRIAAGIVLAAFSYWLLNPVPAPTTEPPSATSTSTPTLTQSLTRLEDKSKAEQDAVHTALVSGGRQLQESAQWSVSALEL